MTIENNNVSNNSMLQDAAIIGAGAGAFGGAGVGIPVGIASFIRQNSIVLKEAGANNLNYMLLEMSEDLKKHGVMPKSFMKTLSKYYKGLPIKSVVEIVIAEVLTSAGIGAVVGGLVFTIDHYIRSTFSGSDSK